MVLHVNLGFVLTPGVVFLCLGGAFFTQKPLVSEEIDGMYRIVFLQIQPTSKMD